MKNKFNIIMILAILLVSMSVASANTNSGISLDLINQNPYPASAGDIVEVRIGIENYGDTVNDLSIDLIDEYPFTIVSDNIQTISTVNSYQEGNTKEILTYKIKVNDDASAGTHDLIIRYYDATAKIITQTTLPIDVTSSDKAEVIHIDKTVLIPGKETEVTFRITNTGKSTLKDLTFSFENPEKAILAVGSDNSRFINAIYPGQSEEITYTVIADTNVDPGLYELSLSLDYDDEYGLSSSKTTTAGIYVGGETSFSLALSDIGSNELTLSVANIGSNPAYSVLVSLPSQQGLSLSGVNSQIVGNLDNGDYTLASFSTGFSAQELEVELSYTDTRGERVVITKNVIMHTSTELGTGMPENLSDLSKEEIQERMASKGGNRPGNPMASMTNPNSDSAKISNLLKNTALVVVVIVLLVVGLKYYKRRKHLPKKGKVSVRK